MRMRRCSGRVVCRDDCGGDCVAVVALAGVWTGKGRAGKDIDRRHLVLLILIGERGSGASEFWERQILILVYEVGWRMRAIVA